MTNYQVEKYDHYIKNPKNFKSFYNCEVFRVPIFSRGSGSNTRLVFNYLSFLISSIFFGIFKFEKKNLIIFLLLEHHH